MRGSRKNYGKGAQMRRLELHLTQDQMNVLEYVAAGCQSVQDIICQLIDQEIERVERIAEEHAEEPVQWKLYYHKTTPF
jgi:hypothetical protein